VLLTVAGLEAEQLIRIERSLDFSSWEGWSTNTAVSNSLMLSIDISGAPQQYFRAALE
jgi:hypothetical protein